MFKMEIFLLLWPLILTLKHGIPTISWYMFNSNVINLPQYSLILQRRFDLLHFVILNFIFLGIEEISWFVAFVTLWSDYRTWAYLTLACMFIEFCLNLLIFFIKSCCRGCCCDCCCDCCKDCCSRDIRDLIISFPFIKTISNMWFGIQLYKLGYGTSNIDPHNSQEIDRITSKGEYEMGLYGSFLTTLLQTITQFVFYRLIGWISIPQIVCISISLLKLIWGIGIKIAACFGDQNTEHGELIEMETLKNNVKKWASQV